MDERGNWNSGQSIVGIKVSRDQQPESTQLYSKRPGLKRKVDGQPFVLPGNRSCPKGAVRFLDQIVGLVKRLSRLPDGNVLSIGVSGGLDNACFWLLFVPVMLLANPS